MRIGKLVLSTSMFLVCCLVAASATARSRRRSPTINLDRLTAAQKKALRTRPDDED